MFKIPNGVRIYEQKVKSEMNASARKTLKILTYLAESPTPMGVTQLAEALGYPKSSVFDILESLRTEEYIEFASEQARTYRVGSQAFRTGCAYAARTDLCRLARPVLWQLSEQTGANAYLAEEKDGILLYLDKADGQAPVRSSRAVGSTNELYRTGLGKALLAAYDPARAAAAAGSLTRRTARTITTPEALTADLKRTRRRGYAVDNGEDNELLCCAAAPVYDHRNEPVAAISVSMVRSAVTEAEFGRAAQLVRTAAKDLSRRMGYTRTKLYEEENDE